MMTDTDVVLRTHRLFSGVADESRAELARCAAMGRFSSNSLILREGAAAGHLNVVASGSVELFTRLGGRETVVSVLGPSAVFFIAPILLNGPCPLSARAIDETRLIRLPAIELRAEIERDSVLLRALSVELAGRHSELLEALKGQKLCRSVRRVARYLLLQHEHQGATGHITLPLNKQRLASLLGMTPSALSRAFSALKRQGVTVNGSEIEFSKPSRLRAFSNAYDAGDGHALVREQHQ